MSVGAVGGQRPAWLPALADFEARHPNWLARGEPVRTPADFLDARRQVELGLAQALMRRQPWQADRDRYGRLDAWHIDEFGDCEDRALAAMQFLRARHPRGWPRAALWPYIVRGRRPWYQGGRRFAHAVLVVWLADRLVMLDSLRRTPELLERPPDAGLQLGYDLWVRVTPDLLSSARPPASPSAS